jgi:PHP family Zn ribbon phosphoesterase
MLLNQVIDRALINASDTIQSTLAKGMDDIGTLDEDSPEYLMKVAASIDKTAFRNDIAHMKKMVHIILNIVEFCEGRSQQLLEEIEKRKDYLSEN